MKTRSGCLIIQTKIEAFSTIIGDRLYEQPKKKNPDQIPYVKRNLHKIVSYIFFHSLKTNLFIKLIDQMLSLEIV